MSTYRTKITDYGYKKKVTVYRQPITYNEHTDTSIDRKSYTEMTDEEKAASDKRRIGYYKKMVSQLVEIAMMNPDLDVALTLTFREPITSYNMALAAWQSFLKRLRHKYDFPLKYICVWEYQSARSKALEISSGGVFHFHCLMNIGFIEHEELVHCWGKGFVWIDHLNGDAKRKKAICYTTKYCVKEVISRIQSSNDIRGQRFYFTSNNLSRPTYQVSEDAADLDQITFDRMEHMLRDGSFDLTNEYGAIYNHIDYIEYKKG